MNKVISFNQFKEDKAMQSFYETMPPFSKLRLIAELEVVQGDKREYAKSFLIDRGLMLQIKQE